MAARSARSSIWRNTLAKTLRLFLDANTIFAAAYSRTGAARELFVLALEGEVCLLTNRDVLLEAERNLKQKAPEAIPLFRLLMELVSPEIVPDPEPELLRAVLEFVIAKDAIVVAGAIAGKADYLVTFDRKHLIDLPEVSKRSSLRIVLPEVVLRVVRGHGKTRTNCDGSEAD